MIIFWRAIVWGDTVLGNRFRTMLTTCYSPGATPSLAIVYISKWVSGTVVVAFLSQFLPIEYNILSYI